MSPVFRHGRLRLYLLKLLDESPRHGYEVIRLLQDRFMGVYAPSPGTIYPRLARLEEEGLVTHDEADGRKVYRITDKGREELRNRADDLSDLEDEITASVRDIAREVTEDVRETVRNLREELTFAARDMHRRGTPPPPPRGGGRAPRTAGRRGDPAGPTPGPTGTWNSWPAVSPGNCGPPRPRPTRSARTPSATCGRSWTTRWTGSRPRSSAARMPPGRALPGPAGPAGRPPGRRPALPAGRPEADARPGRRRARRPPLKKRSRTGHQSVKIGSYLVP